MNIRTTIAMIIVAGAFGPTAFCQSINGYGREMSAGPPNTAGRQSKSAKTTGKTTYPHGVKGYLDQQMAGSKDKKFHVAVNGKDLALTPVNIHEERKMGGNKSSAAADMKGADGKMYEIDFVLSDGVVTGANIGKVNGEKP